MTIWTIKALLLVAFAGHLALWRCDAALSRPDGGRFRFSDMKDNAALSSVMGQTPLARPMRAGVWGGLIMTAMFPAYLALCFWMHAFSPAAAWAMFAGSLLLFVPGIAHHYACGATEWLYLRLGKTEAARGAIVDFFKASLPFMIACAAGLILFSGAQLLAVALGKTPLPRWACLCNILPAAAVLASFRVVGTGNLAGAAMTLGMFFLL